MGALVAPCGRAWERCNDQYPLVNLYAGDGYHSNVIGTYLTSCVFYAALFQQSPVGIEYVNDSQVTPALRDLLQNLAWETVRECGPRWE